MCSGPERQYLLGPFNCCMQAIDGSKTSAHRFTLPVAGPADEKLVYNLPATYGSGLTIAK